jgi:Zn-dependent M28 family amino/carboxypeptidase
MYSGHWDHLGVGLPDAKGDKIYNGAVDNATGIAALLELARAYAAAPGAAAQRGVPGGDGRREGPARLRVLRRESAVSAGRRRSA